MPAVSGWWKNRCPVQPRKRARIPVSGAPWNFFYPCNLLIIKIFCGICRAWGAARALPRRGRLGIFTALLSAVAKRLPRRASDFSRDRFRRTAQVSGLVSHRKRPGAWNRNWTGRYRSRSRHHLGRGFPGSRPLFDGRLFLDCFFLRRLSGRLFFARFPVGARLAARAFATRAFPARSLARNFFLQCLLLPD